MKKQYQNRLSRIVLCAALAFMFWLFDLTILAWVFGALVILPIVIGGLILIGKEIPHPEEDEEYELSPSELRDQEARLQTLEEAAKLMEEFKNMRESNNPTNVYQPNVDNTTEPPKKK
jgi:hypothetical protein